MKKVMLIVVLGLGTIPYTGCFKDLNTNVNCMKQIPAGSFLMGVDSIYQTAGIVNPFGDTIHQVTRLGIRYGFHRSYTGGVSWAYGGKSVAFQRFSEFAVAPC